MDGILVRKEHFKIGENFYSELGVLNKCTDIGTRTICAVEMGTEHPKSWYLGPPYSFREIVFDATRMRKCYRTEHERDNQGFMRERIRQYPVLSDDVLNRMYNMHYDTFEWFRYPHGELLNHDRVDYDGEVFCPCGAKPASTSTLAEKDWIIQVYDLRSQYFTEVPEYEFKKWTIATDEELVYIKHELDNKDNV